MRMELKKGCSLRKHVQEPGALRIFPRALELQGDNRGLVRLWRVQYRPCSLHLRKEPTPVCAKPKRVLSKSKLDNFLCYIKGTGKLTSSGSVLTYSVKRIL